MNARYALPVASTSSRTPSLEKLQPVPSAPLQSPSPALDAPPRTRLKDLRERTLVRKGDAAVLAARNQQEQHRSCQFHGRWRQLRDVYALTSETVAARASRRTLSPMSPLLLPSRRSAPGTPSAPSPAASGAPEPSVATPSTAAAAWLVDVASELRRAFPVPDITLTQLEIAVSKALRVEGLFSTPALAGVAARWRAAFAALQRVETPLKSDFRELLSALSVLDRRRAGARRLLELWFEEFATVPLGSKTLAVAKRDLRRMLFTACEGGADETRLEPFADELCAVSGGAYVSERALAAYVDATPELLEVLEAQVWRRQTDDMRLAFYRDQFAEAHARLQEEQLRVRLECAVRFWRSREPRLRLARWRRFVADRRLFRRGDAHFRATSSRKVVLALHRQRRRRQETRDLVAIARVQHHGTLELWTFRGWQRFFVSMQLVHAAAWKRGVEHHRRVWKRKLWRGLVRYFESEMAFKAARQAKLEAFVAARHRKMVRASLDDWCYFHHRRKDVVAAELRERELHRDIGEQNRVRSELVRMEIEDAVSRAVETKSREALELERQRAFQDATNRVHAHRKLKQQEDARTRRKQDADARLRTEMDATWQSLAVKVRVEVRQSTLAWFATPEGSAAVASEASRIFEQDPNVLQRALLQDPQALVLPGCRWQLQLEDYGGRFAKPFYLNAETFEKLMCDELVLENCEDIAKEVLVQRRIDAASLALERKAAALLRQRQEHDAARRIQALFRCRHALLVARSLVRSLFVKRVDPSSGTPVYLNMRRVETRRRPPKIMGSDEPLIPVESTSWVRRVDDHGISFYERLDARDGDSEPAWSWRPPNHFLLCTRCHEDFASRRWSDSGARVCIGCFATELQRRRRERQETKKGEGSDAAWTKISVQPASCVVCRHTLADWLCHDCRGDVTCERCFRAVHASSKLANHSRQQRLLYDA